MSLSDKKLANWRARVRYSLNISKERPVQKDESLLSDYLESQAFPRKKNESGECDPEKFAKECTPEQGREFPHLPSKNRDFD